MALHAVAPALEPVIQIGGLGRRGQLKAGWQATRPIAPLDLVDQGIGVADRPLRVREHRIGAARHARIEAQAPAPEPGRGRRRPGIGADVLEQADKIDRWRHGLSSSAVGRLPFPMAARER
jgi:hypothetical protein